MHDIAKHGLIEIAKLLEKHGISVDDEDKVRKFFSQIFNILYVNTK